MTISRAMLRQVAPSPTYLAMRAYSRGRRTMARLRREVPWKGVRILGYHRVDEVRDDLSVRPAAFREQMERVRELDVEPIPLERVADMLGRPIEGRYVCVTFDDGYRDNLERAVPVLEELRIPATIFVPTEAIDGRPLYTWLSEQPPALSWAEIDELVRGGLIDVQSHTRTHPRLPQVDDDRAWEEIAGSKRDLEKRVPYEVTSFCYPAGLHGERDVRYVEQAGYRLGLSTTPGVTDGGESPFRLNRTLLYFDDRMADFVVKMSGRLDHASLGRESLYRALRRARSAAPTG